MYTIPTLIIGAGVAGASLACSLAGRENGRGVVVVDPDVFGKLSSSELNPGGIRASFAKPLLVKLALQSIDYYQQVAQKVDFRRCGYLWLHATENPGRTRKFLPVMREFDIPLQELSTQDVASRYPYLSNLTDVSGATLTPTDGRLSPHKLRLHYLNHAQAGGVELMDGWVVTKIDGDRSPFDVTLTKVTGRAVRKALVDGTTPGTPQTSVASQTLGAAQGSVTSQASVSAQTSGTAQTSSVNQTLTVRVTTLMNCAGPWAGRVAGSGGVTLPIRVSSRQGFLLHQPSLPIESMPLIVDDAQQLGFRPFERDRRPCMFVSWSDPDAPRKFDFTFKGAPYYMEHVRPHVERRMPGLVGAELVGGWASHYDLSPDRLPIVGPVPGRAGMFNYNGLSIHGVILSRALGEAMAVQLVHNRWPVGLDLNELTAGRFDKPRVSDASSDRA